ncbi:MAG: polysaccharide biosynthesis protein [Clostridiaceae bacterium]|jgi:stage V sporulation protein B|nr:polysaccharide biosynthesis protein [Clostridiaceae bacterium]
MSGGPFEEILNGAGNAKNTENAGTKNTAIGAENYGINATAHTENAGNGTAADAENSERSAMDSYVENSKRGMVYSENTGNGTAADTENTDKRKAGVGFMRGALVLSVTAIIAKLLGAFYRIPLTNILGAEGMGLYQLVFPVYALFLSVATGGMSVAVSRSVAEKNALGESPAGVLKAAALVIFALSAVAAVACRLSAIPASALQGNGEAAALYKVMSPAIFFAGGLAFFRGWFQGNMRMLPTGLSQLTEQAVKLAAGLAFAYLFLPQGTTAAAAGAILGVTVSEAAAFLILAAMFAFSKKRNIGHARLDKNSLREMLKIALPIATGSLLLPLAQLIDSFMLINLLKATGATIGGATGGYGILTAPVASLVNLPIVLTISLAVAIVPAVSAGRVDRNIDSVLKKSALGIKCAYIIGLPCAFIMLIFASPILRLLYPALAAGELSLAVTLLRISAFEIFFMSGMHIYAALLQALDRASAPLKNLAAGIGLKVVLTLVLVPRIGLAGSAIATLAMAFTAYALDAVSLRRLLAPKTGFVKNVAEIMLAGVITGAAAALFFKFIPSPLTAFLTGAAVSVVLYVCLLAAFKVFDRDELASFPFGKRLRGKKRSKNLR